MEKVIIELYKVGALKFGNFTLKSGIKSPVYVDLRVIVSHPLLLQQIADLLVSCIEEKECQFDHVCGVPYTALPIATIVSVKCETSMLLRRKEPKSYGTMKIIEGEFGRGDYCLIVEDIVTSGSSVLETADALTAEGLIANEAIVVIDREQGGVKNLAGRHITVHSLATMSQVLDVLAKEKLIDQARVDSVKKFSVENIVSLPVNALSKRKTDEPCNGDPASKKLKNAMSFEKRADLCTNAVAKKLFKIMADKETNLALSADVSSCAQLLQIAEALGPKICILKTHADILTDFSPDVGEQLVDLAKRHNFIIFEDRKFADIGKTAKLQFSEGFYKISKWADLVNAHALPGPGVIEGLREVSQEGKTTGQEKACLLISQMSSQGSLFTEGYTEATVKLAESYSDFVIGFICQKRVSSNPALLHMTPGVHISNTQDTLGQRYITPEMAIKELGNDIIIVGQGIMKATDPLATAEQYRSVAYAAYKETLSL